LYRREFSEISPAKLERNSAFFKSSNGSDVMLNGTQRHATGTERPADRRRSKILAFFSIALYLLRVLLLSRGNGNATQNCTQTLD
jgi:hypothetical protein